MRRPDQPMIRTIHARAAGHGEDARVGGALRARAILGKLTHVSE